MTIRVAAVQAAPVWQDAAGTLHKTLRLIEEAGRKGVQLLAFGEVWLPGYPFTIFLKPPLETMPIVMRHRQNAVAADGPEMRTVADAARKAGVWVVLGYAERDKSSIYCSQAIIDNHGRLVMNRRKLRPTHMERTLWGEGRVEGLNVVDTPLGRLGALNCYENVQPLNRQAMIQAGEQLHVMSWPSFGIFEGIPGTYALSKEACMMASASYALEAGCFVIAANGIIPEEDRHEICMSDPEGLKIVGGGGGSAAIFGPDGARLTEPLDPWSDGMAIADIDLADIEAAKIFTDPGGHYYRSDVAAYVLSGPHPPVRIPVRGGHAVQRDETASRTPGEHGSDRQAAAASD